MEESQKYLFIDACNREHS